MTRTAQRFWRGMFCILGTSLMLAHSAWAVPPSILPGPSDVNRVRIEDRAAPVPEKEGAPVAAPKSEPPPTRAPSGDKTAFLLKQVTTEGVTAFPMSEIEALYKPYIGERINLDIAFAMADKVTAYYRSQGYFLSVANVMSRDEKAGTVHIKVTEGYIGDVEVQGKGTDWRVLQEYIAQIKEAKPISTAKLESFLLRLNDLPGLAFRAVLAPADLEDEAAVKLVLSPGRKQGSGALTFDNYGSRFLGPNELIASYSTSFVPMTQTSLSLIGSMPVDELIYGTFEHAGMVAPDLTLGLMLSKTRAQPGFNLAIFEIESDSESLGLYAKYQYLRQRDENLSFRFTFDGRHSTSDILGVPFMRDDIRALRLNASYDKADSYNGVTNLNATLSQGIDGLGSSRAGESNLSRAEAKPDFTKLELSASRQQLITDNWSVLVSASGQIASGALFSSEEFGYGGQVFGRAYDASEITGDQGFNGSVEVRYAGWSGLDPISLVPYAFYDAGIVWNVDQGQADREDASSAGAGLRFATGTDTTGNVSLAWPLTREIVTPVYGEGRKGPRLLLQLSQSF